MRFSLFLLTAVFCFSALVALAQPSNPFSGLECDQPLFPTYDKKTRLFGYQDITGNFVIPPSFIRAYAFEGKFALVLQGTKYGFVNCEGRIITPAIYDEIRQFYYGRGWGLRAGKWGLFDVPGKDILPPSFDDIRPVHPRRPLVWFKRNEKWGLFDRDVVRYVVPEKYDAVSPISDSVAVVKKGAFFAIYDYSEATEVLDSISLVRTLNERFFGIYRKNKWGVINLFGRALVAPQYDSVQVAGNLFLVQDGKHFGVLALTGKTILPATYDELGSYSEGYVAYRQGNLWGYACGVIKKLVPPSFLLAQPIKDSLAIVRLAPSGKYALWHIGRKAVIEQGAIYHRFYRNLDNGLLIGVIGSQHFVLNNEAVRMSSFAADSIFIYDPAKVIRCKSRKGYRLYDTDTRSIVDGPFWKKIGTPFRGYQAAADSLDYVWLLDGKEIGIKSRYDSVKFLAAGKAVLVQVWKNTNTGFCSSKGDVILPTIFQEILLDDQIFKVKKDEKWGLYSIKGEEILRPGLDKISTAQEIGVAFPAIAQKGNRQYLITKQGALLTDGYREIKYLDYGMFAGLGKSSAVLLKPDGIEVKMKAMQEIGKFSNGLAAAKTDGKWGFINVTGNFLIPPTYREVLAFQGKTTYAKLNDKWGSINQQNKVLVPFSFSSFGIKQGVRYLVP